MHLIVPFAAPGPDAGRQALRNLALPGLARWLAGSAPAGREEGDEMSLSPPHERALAQAWGWHGADGALPFAAHAAAADGLAATQGAWGLLTPVHLHLGTEQVSLIDPALLALDETASRDFFAVVQPLFETEGIAVHWGAPGRWYAVCEGLAGLPGASLDRVIGRNVDAWLQPHPQARLFRRLQNEVQMLLHEHPLNEARAAQGLLAVNSIWLSGCGALQPVPAAAATAVRVDDRLRAPALADDWAAWCKAWDVVDADLAARPPQRLTLCGERAWAAFERRPPSLLGRLRAALAGPVPQTVMEGL